MSSSSRSPGAERLRRAAAALALAAALATPAVAGNTLPEHVARYIADARLAGSGRLNWYGFHVYDADLYARAPLDPREPTAQPFVLELRYARRLKGAAIAEASRDEMARLGFGTEAQRAAWSAEMTRIFPDVSAGRRLAAVNLPGRGTRFYSDGSFVGAIADPRFAPAFFAIWLDERTQAPQLRAALLPASRSPGDAGA